MARIFYKEMKIIFMENNQNVAEVLNDLIQINNDRIAGYERALKELKDNDSDLRTLFTGFIDQSRNLRNTLGTEVETLGVRMDDGTTSSGKIYRAWMDVKALFTGSDRQTVLNNCETGEDAAQKAYKSALKTENLPAYLFALINKQKDELRGAHDEVKALRDSEKLQHENA
ncbi:MAG: PA2169 family four-helix-bundle protein [Parafilimonas sp.]